MKLIRRRRSLVGSIIPVVLFAAVLAAVAAAGPAAKGDDIRLVTDEADAVLAVLDRLRSGQPAGEDVWRAVFASEGYVRLKKRELSLKRPFEDDAFRAFAASPELLARADRLAETLERWKKADLKTAVGRARAYLPDGTAIKVKIYPVIKPRENSFVFELDRDPAIFLYLNPDMTAAQFINTVAHELHHIGQAAACGGGGRDGAADSRPAPVRSVLEWIGSFGEGVAMVAAAGGPDVHPHAESPAADRERWDRDMASFEADFRKVEAFFLDVLDGRLKGEEAIREAGMAFFGIQGPWYTVGWKMAVLIETTFGRKRVVAGLCDTAGLLAAYNEAAAARNSKVGESWPLWPARMLVRLRT